MNRSIIRLLILTLGVAVATTACKKSQVGVTPLVGQNRPPGGDRPRGPITDVPPGRIPQDGTGPQGQNLPTTTSGIATGGRDAFDKDWDIAEVQPLKSETVYFGFDQSTIQTKEHSKLKAVADYLNSNTQNALLVEGHCDERGTDEYNRALGEKRALAIREYLSNAGISAARVRTVSYGRDRLVDLGLDEAAHAKNRRGEFIVLVPKK